VVRIYGAVMMIIKSAALTTVETAAILALAITNLSAATPSTSAMMVDVVLKPDSFLPIRVA
jgi:hypothetical protein